MILGIVHMQALQSRELGAKVADNVAMLSGRLDREERTAEQRTTVVRNAIEAMTAQQVVPQTTQRVIRI